jgi:hypothetical protein
VKNNTRDVWVSLTFAGIPVTPPRHHVAFESTGQLWLRKIIVPITSKCTVDGAVVYDRIEEAGFYFVELGRLPIAHQSLQAEDTLQLSHVPPTTHITKP